MTAIEIARRLSQIGQSKDACNAYVLVLQMNDAQASERLEACCYLLENDEDPRISMTSLIRLYNDGFFKDDIFHILTQMFYQTHEQGFQKRYERNCKFLSKYPYLFRKDFPSFQDLPVRFLPYDERGGYIPFSLSERRFDAFINVEDTVVSRNFFKDLEKPVLADDVYSQYELEYLRDNVRLSEHIGRENHIYLHYADWQSFCSWLQILDFKSLLKKKQFVLLFEDEINRYPIDFKSCFGIDYGQYPTQRVKIREVKRLIWHAQLSSSNGGDFFNEVLDAHPNLLYVSSLMYETLVGVIEKIKRRLQESPTLGSAQKNLEKWNNPKLVRDLYNLKNRTDTDILVATFMQRTENSGTLDASSRIVPALLLQPHFGNVTTILSVTKKGETILDTNVYDIIRSSPLLNGFPYVKTFTPIRRFTTSYGSTVKFIESQLEEFRKRQNAKEREEPILLAIDLAMERILNRTYMRDPQERLFRDSIIVRFEDGKLNPQATFSKLAEFLDIPYTESMTYCSENNVRDVRTEEGNVVGFDPATVYRTYSEYVTDSERSFLEYFMRDAYQYYGYSFQCYDGSPADGQRVQEWMKHFDRLDKNIMESWSYYCEEQIRNALVNGGKADAELALAAKGLLNEMLQKRDANRQYVVNTLQRGLRFVNKNGQPLEMTPMLQPDPALLVQPLYH